MKQSFAEIKNGQTLAYVQLNELYKNKNPTLLFVHGNFSANCWWHDTINAIAKEPYHIIAIDLRGFGKSSYKQPCSKFQDWAGDLVQVLQLMQIELVVCMGWSFGGGVCMKLSQLSSKVLKVVLTCSVSHEGLVLYTQGKPCKTKQQIEANNKVVFMNHVIKQKNVESMKKIFQTVLFTHAKNYPLQKANTMIGSCFQQRCYVEVIYALANCTIHIENIKAKVLMVHGRHDLVVSLQSVMKTGEYFKNFEIWENNAHMIPIQNIEGYAEKIMSFIKND